MSAADIPDDIRQDRLFNHPVYAGMSEEARATIVKNHRILLGMNGRQDDEERSYYDV